MREIKFRGKQTSTGRWLYGYYLEIPAPPQCIGKSKPPTAFIIFENPHYLPDWGMPRQMVQDDVDINTVGQYTGLKDKNGVEIYEGDILKAAPNGAEFIGAVYYEDSKWFGACDYLDYAVAYSGAEIIGNIHDNPELLEENI